MSRPDGDTMHARRSGGSGDSASTSRSMMRQLAPRTMSGGSGGANSAPNLAPSGGMGESGRRLSNRLRSMREAEHVGDAPSLARYAGGHTFRSVSGVWIDAQYRRGMRELRLEYASRGYFALVRARPDLRAALALGARVVIAIDGNRAIVVDTARSPAGEAEVQRFLAEHAR